MGIFFTIIRILPLLTLVAMASIAPFPLIRKCIGTGRSYILIAVAAGIGIFVLFARGFTSVFGPTQTTPDVFVTVIPPSLFLVFPFIEIVVYSTALYGIAALFWYIIVLPHRRSFRAIFFCGAAAASLLLLEWAALAGIALIIYLGIKRFRSDIVSWAVVLSVGLLLAVAGPALMKIPGAERHFVVTIVPFIIIGCAIASAFTLHSDKTRLEMRLPVLFSGAILSLLASYFVMTYILNPTGSLLSWLVTVPGEPLLRLYLILMFATVFTSAAIIFWIFVPLIGWYLEKSTIYNPGRKLE